MQSFSEDEIKKIFGEVFSDNQKAILEYVKDMPTMNKKIQKMDSKVDNIEADIRTIKLAIKDSSKQLMNHEKRIGKLELNV